MVQFRFTIMTDHFQFDPLQLAGPRPPGISAFMRVKNGQDFLALAIESHIDCFDEIVVAYNGCTDRTVPILERLRQKHGEKLKLYHYEPRVYPPGSDGHRRSPTASIHSLANFYNFSLAKTTCRVATKLDDDHIAIPATLRRITDRIRAADYHLGGEMHCFSGMNLAQGRQGVGVFATTPFAGNGDHGFFEVSPQNYFVQDRRFERFVRTGLRRTFCGMMYWHLKYLKQDYGFANYELEDNPDSRYHKQLARMNDNTDVISLDELWRRCRRRTRLAKLRLQTAQLFSDKYSIVLDRYESFDPQDYEASFHALVDRLGARAVDPADSHRAA